MNYKAIIDDFNQASLHNPSEEIKKRYLHIEEIVEQDPFGNTMIRPLFSHSSLPEVLDLELIKLDECSYEGNYIYSTMLHHNAELAITHLNLLHKKVLQLIRNKKCKLILDNTLEGDTIERFLPILFNSLDNLGLPYNQVYFITNNLIAKKYYYQWIEKSKNFISSFNLKSTLFFDEIFKDNFKNDSVNIIEFPWNIHDTNRLITLKHLPKAVNIEKEIEYKTANIDQIKPFLKVNRTGRPERTTFMLYLNYYKLLDKFKISFPRLEYLNEFEPLLHQKFPEVLSKQNIELLQSKIPFDIDQTDKDNHGKPGIGIGKFNADLPFNPIHYKDTFISIVMCAFPHTENACHLHSSTFNPIYCGHPYIGFGPLNHLNRLRELGFKTFNRWWDESYDNHPHHLDRLEQILILTEKLSKYSNSDFLEMYKEMKHTLQYNSDLIKNFNGKNELSRIILQ